MNSSTDEMLSTSTVDQAGAPISGSAVPQVDTQEAKSAQTKSAGSPEEKRKKRKRLFILLAILGLLLLLAGIGGYYYLNNYSNDCCTENIDENENTDENNQNENAEEADDQSNNQGTVPDPVFNSVAYIHLNNPQIIEDNKVVLKDLDTLAETELNLLNVTTVYNQPNSKYFVFMDNANILKVYNKSTGGITAEIEHETLPGDVVPFMMASNTVLFSPDGNKFLYKIDYRDETSCQEICPEADPYPAGKIGYYSYDIASASSVYLGNFLLPSNWDSTSKYVYTSTGSDYHDYQLGNGVFRIDAATGTALKVHEYESGIFGTQYAYSDILAKYVYLHYVTMSSPVEMTVEKDGSKQVIDTSAWAVLQPHIHLSKSQEFAVYRKDTVPGPSSALMQLVLLNLNSNVKSALTTPAVGRTHQFMNWSGNKVLYMDSSYGTPDSNSDLYMVDVTTGQVTRLTDKGDARMF